MPPIYLISDEHVAYLSLLFVVQQALERMMNTLERTSALETETI